MLTCQNQKNIIKQLILLFATIFVMAWQTVSADNWDQKVKGNHIEFPGKFYTKEIKTCSAMPGNKSYSRSAIVKQVEALIGYDWSDDHTKNSNSITVNHEGITTPIKIMMTSTHNALSKRPCDGHDCNKNIDEIAIAKRLLVDLAKANTLYNSIGYYEVKEKPKCWENNDPNSPCWYHEYEFAAQWFGNYMITALWLKGELNKREFKVVNKYINYMYKKFVGPTEFKSQDKGFYAMANGGMPILIYASWTNNKKLAAKEINFRFKEINRLFFDDGYINNNSFRGHRGQWYHSYGLDSALGYVYIADLWGAPMPEKLYHKLVKASEVANLAITDWSKFKSRKFSGDNSNKISNENNAIKHTHQMAIALDTLMEIVTGVKLANDPVYLIKRKFHIKDGIDDLIGFNPNCVK